MEILNFLVFAAVYTVVVHRTRFQQHIATALGACGPVLLVFVLVAVRVVWGMVNSLEETAPAVITTSLNVMDAVAAAGWWAVVLMGGRPARAVELSVVRIVAPQMATPMGPVATMAPPHKIRLFAGRAEWLNRQRAPRAVRVVLSSILSAAVFVVLQRVKMAGWCVVEGLVASLVVVAVSRWGKR